MTHEGRRASLIIIAAATLLWSGLAPSSPGAEERVIYMTAIEPKGATTVDREPFPTTKLPQGAGYVRKSPDATGRWEISAYQWSPAIVVVQQGDRVTLEIIGINGASHAAHIDQYHPEHFVVKRGEITRIQFTADTPGTFKIHCQVHEPGMVGYLVVLPR